MEDTLTYKLREPIELAGEITTELQLREPTVDELDRAQSKATTQLGVVINLLVYVTGKSEAVIRRMRQRDFVRASNFLSGFSEGGLDTGEASSLTSPAGTDGVHGTLAA